jgi:two-component system sensor histidine kinase EvgS
MAYNVCMFRSMRTAGRLAVAALLAYATAAAAQPVSLTPDERAWLDAHGSLRYAPDPGFPPFEFFRDNGELAGATPELLELVARKLGTRIEVVRYSTWTDVMAGMKRGEVDVLGTLTKTPERDKFLLFTKPYIEVPFVLFLRNDTDPLTKLGEVPSMRLGVVEGVGAYSWIREHHPERDLVLVQTVREGLLLLSLGHLDGFVETLPVGAEIISDLGLNNLRVSPDVLSTQPQHLGVALTNAMLRGLLQKGLDAIPEPERDRVLRHWMGFEMMQRAPAFPVWAERVIAAGLLLLLLLLAWIVSLRRVVAVRTRALRTSEDHYRTLLENLPQMIFLKDVNSVYISCNARYAASMGLEAAQIAGKTDFEFYPRELAEKYRADDREVMKSQQVLEFEEQHQAQGVRRMIHTVKTPVFDEHGAVRGVLGIFWDISERKQHEAARERLELQLRQAQKMEAVGRLAGGVAHDFNNILTVILGNANLLAEESGLSPEARAVVAEIAQAAGRASELTRQLLTFSRRQVAEMRPLDLNEVVRRMQPMLDPIARGRITLSLELGADLPAVLADANMMEQVVLNLALNARDAMPEGGVLTLRTRLEEIASAATLAGSARPPGRHVVLEVQDTGLGMDEETKAHLFEPFYTTKEVGRGTGLGLASVYGVVQQHLGWIDVESAPGRGTTFSMYIPAAADRAATPVSPEPAGPIPRGTEFILVVEDETSLRRMTLAALQRLGYRVREAASGEEAEALWTELGGEIDLLLTDVVMPGRMSGLQLAREWRARRPNLPMVICSGYSEDVLYKKEELPADAQFLPKPYDIRSLAATVREALDAAG